MPRRAVRTRRSMGISSLSSTPSLFSPVRYLPSMRSWLFLTVALLFFSCSLYRVDDVYDRPAVRRRVRSREKLEFCGSREVINDYLLLYLAIWTDGFPRCELYLYLTGTISLKLISWSLAIYSYYLPAGEFMKFQEGFTARLNRSRHPSLCVLLHRLCSYHGHLASGPSSLVIYFFVSVHPSFPPTCFPRHCPVCYGFWFALGQYETTVRVDRALSLESDLVTHSASP